MMSTTANQVAVGAQREKTAKPNKKKTTKPQRRRTTVVKQSVGIDVGKDSLQVCFRNKCSDGAMVIKAQKEVKNTKAGWKAIGEMIKKYAQSEVVQGLVVVMEATGVYYENVCYYLHELGYKINVILPNNSKNFAKSLNIVTKTDKSDAQILAQMGLERSLEEWQIPDANMRLIRDLGREREGLIEQRTAVKNQLHALQNSNATDKAMLKRTEKHIKFIDDQIDAVEEQMQSIIAQDPTIAVLVKRIETIPGIGFITAAVIVGETNGFANFTSRAQLTSYAGYDVIEDQSGKHIGKTKMSKRGNSHLRRALYFPAVSAVQYNPTMTALQQRVCDRTKIPMKGYVAVQRKLLCLAFTLCKTQTNFDSKYQQTIADKKNTPIPETQTKTDPQTLQK